MKNNEFLEPEMVFNEKFLKRVKRKTKKKGKELDIKVKTFTFEIFKEYPDHVFIGIRVTGFGKDPKQFVTYNTSMT